MSAAGVLAAAMAMLPTTAVLADKGVVPLLLIALATAAPLAWMQGWRPSRPPLSALFAVAILCWAFVTVLWSFDPVDDASRAFRVLVLVVCGWLVFDLFYYVKRQSDLPIKMMVLGLLAGLFVLAFEMATNQVILKTFASDQGSVVLSELNRGATTIAILIWPVAAMLYARGNIWRTIGLIITTGAVLAFTISGSAKVAFLVGLTMLWISLCRRNVASFLTVAAIIVGALGTPWIVQTSYNMGLHEQTGVPLSWQHRVHIWNFSADRIFEQPISGWGFNSARRMPDYDEALFMEDQESIIPSHPHNASLQVWMDLGIVGLALYILLWLSIFKRLSNMPNPEFSFLLAAFTATITIASVSYGLWQTQWVATILWICVWSVSLHGRESENAATS